jgi:peptidoglycan/xylan/chitin deacetylase (PgdA/CDA1 family)
MRFYKFPKWQQWFYPKAIFDFHNQTELIELKTIYLTFDDGPTLGITNEILEILDVFNAKATFFCVGKKVKSNPELFQEIIKKGHSVGNHSMTHLNGFKTPTKTYVSDVLEAKKYIDSNLFRPPYGKCTPKQHKELNKLGFKTVFWSHLTYDFDSVLTHQKRFNKLRSESKSGSIIVFHDTLNSFNEIEFKRILEYYRESNYKFQSITN